MFKHRDHSMVVKTTHECRYDAELKRRITLYRRVIIYFTSVNNHVTGSYLTSLDGLVSYLCVEFHRSRSGHKRFGVLGQQDGVIVTSHDIKSIR